MDQDIFHILQKLVSDTQKLSSDTKEIRLSMGKMNSQWERLEDRVISLDDRVIGLDCNIERLKSTNSPEQIATTEMFRKLNEAHGISKNDLSRIVAEDLPYIFGELPTAVVLEELRNPTYYENVKIAVEYNFSEQL